MNLFERKIEKLQYISILYDDHVKSVKLMVQEHYDRPEYDGYLISINIVAPPMSCEFYSPWAMTSKYIYYNLEHMETQTNNWWNVMNTYYHDCMDRLEDFQIWDFDCNNIKLFEKAVQPKVKFMPLRFTSLIGNDRLIPDDKPMDLSMVSALTNGYQNHRIEVLSTLTCSYNGEMPRTQILFGDTITGFVKELDRSKFILDIKSLDDKKDSSVPTTQNQVRLFECIELGYHVLAERSTTNFFPGLITEFERIEPNDPGSIKELIDLTKTLQPQNFREQYKGMTWTDEAFEKYKKMFYMDYSEYFHGFSTHRWDILNKLIEKYHYNDYLEIGIYTGDNFNRINISNKTGVDPNPLCETDHTMTSDAYFASTKDDAMFDIIFVDGLHEHEQCYKDIVNSLKHLRPNGTIVCHDMNPLEEKCLHPEHGSWTGDVYKSLLRTASEQDDVSVSLVHDCDWGLGIIRKDHTKWATHKDWDIDFDRYDKEKYDLINCVSLEDYLKTFEESTNKDIVVCAIMKQEYDYVLEWVRYHLSIGFDKIYIYDNNDKNGERYDDLLKEYMDAGTVEIRDCRGKQGVQKTIYHEFYNEGNFGWVFFEDADEFLSFTPESGVTTIQEFLAKVPDADTVMFKWVCYGSFDPKYKSDVLHSDARPIPGNTRKRGFGYPVDIWPKSITRSGIPNVEMNEHFITNIDRGTYKVYNGDCQRTWGTLVGSNYSCAYVKHYIIRNAENFLYKKYLRGHACGTSNINDGDTNGYWTQDLSHFVDISQTLTVPEQQYFLNRGFKMKIQFSPTIIIILNTENIEDEYFNKVCGDIYDNLYFNFDIICYLNASNPETMNHKLEFLRDPLRCHSMYSSNSKLLNAPGSVNFADYHRNNGFLQQPLILNIDFARNLSQEENYNNLKSTFLDMGFVYNMAMDLAVKSMGKKVICCSSKDLIYDDTDFMWNDGIQTILTDMGTNLTDLGLSGLDCHLRINNNTFLTNLSTYDVITMMKEYIIDHNPPITEQYIIDNTNAGYSTIYQEYMHIYPNAAEFVMRY